MKSIKSKDTKVEIILRKKLWAEGYRYRKNILEGKESHKNRDYWIPKSKRNT